MIVLFGTANDPILQAVSAALTRRDAAHRLVDQRRPPPRLDAGPPVTTVDGQPVEAVVLRPVAITDLAAAERWPLDGPEAAAAASFASEFLARCEFEPWLVVNRLSAQASNLSKPWQLQRIKAWFDVPRTLVTTDPAAATAFAGSCQRMIVKSISAVRSIVREVDAERDLDTVAHCPTLFQQRIDGTDVRVHTIGTDIYATRMVSDADDYRYDPVTHREPCPLPADVARRCTALSASLGLHLAGIDLRVTRDGRWVCFEVNPSPAFTYFEPWPASPIADALAASLATASHSAAAPPMPTTSICIGSMSTPPTQDRCVRAAPTLRT